MKKFLLFFITIFCVSSLTIRAQSEKSVAILKSQPLVVVLKEEEPDKLKKLAKKPAELAAYKAFIANYNAQIAELAPKLWHLSPSIEFKRESEMDALVKDKNYQRGELTHENFTVREHLAGGAARGPVLYASSSQTAFLLSVISNGTKRVVMNMPIAPGVVYPSDIILCLKTAQYQLQQAANGKNTNAQLAESGKRLRSKTLLLDEAEVNGKLSAAEIKQVYPFAFQLVSREAIETAVREGDTRYACVRIMPVMSDLFAQVVMDAADGAVLSMSMGGKGFKSGDVISKGNLKDFAQAAGGK